MKVWIDLMQDTNCQSHKPHTATALCLASPPQNKDIYLLDDPLAAVDSNVAEHLMKKCIVELLQGKTRILCTHRIEFVDKADMVVLMDNGTIIKTGTKKISELDDFGPVKDFDVSTSYLASEVRQGLLELNPRCFLPRTGTPAEILPLVEAVPKKRKNNHNMKEKGMLTWGCSCVRKHLESPAQRVP